jgi:hypothetical protein
VNRMTAATDVAIEDGEYNFRFCARKPFAEPR